MNASPGGPSLTAEDHPLLRPLQDVQYELLDTIFTPVISSVASWPVWDYVKRTVYRARPNGPGADALFRSLPSVAKGLQLRNYGLVWQAENRTYEPLPEEHVGLSIAGLYHLGDRRQEARELADLLATFIGYAANWERELVPEPDRPVSMAVPLVELLRQLISRGRYAGQLSPLNLVDVLQREFANLNLSRSGDGSDVTLKLGAGLAPFWGVQTAADYVARIEYRVAETAIEVVPPLFVAHMLDYLSLVLATHPAWPDQRLVEAPDLRAAATLALGAQTDSEFKDRLSALAAILSSLRVPPIGAEDLAKRFDNRQPASLVRLRVWLETNLADAGAQERAVGAVERLRSVIALRNEGQHPSTSQRNQAAKARRALDLPELIIDWAAAWNAVRAQVAQACETIAVEARAN